MDVKKTVNDIYDKFKTLNPDELAECMDIIILDVPLPQDTRGIFQKYHDIDIIYLNESLNENERRITLAHEVSHAILHSELNRIFLDNHTLLCLNRYENEANLLASHMIISDDALLEYLEKYEYTIYQISCMTGIDVKFIQKRISKLEYT